MKRIALFDLDGTLTPPRKSMSYEMASALSELHKNNFEIAIVTGSDLEYIKDQCRVMWDLSPVDPREIHFMPCNGTKYYRMAPDFSFEEKYTMNMREAIGQKKYRKLLQLLLSLQSVISHVHRKIPLTGTFIQYRGSTINWCPIGRSADDNDRSEWMSLNKNNLIRKKWLQLVIDGFQSADLNELVIKFGGDTSYDIYPCGWDKTYAFKEFKEYEEIYFVGDRCLPSGNDYEAFIHAGKNGYSTSGPEETMEIIAKIIGKIR